MKLLFYGTPDTAVPFLELCAREHEVVLVVTQPDRPSGRKLELAPPPVKRAADRLGLKSVQPNKPAQVLAELQAARADIAVVVAYGRLLPDPVIAAPRLGTLNVHFSLLPKYRGAAPIQWALLNGETRSGVSLFWIDAGMDTGPLFLTQECAVSPEDDAAALETKLVELGVRALKGVLDRTSRGDVLRLPQQGEPSLAPLIDKTLGALDFNLGAAQVHNKVRALREWPTAYLETKTKEGKPVRLAVLKTLPPEDREPAPAGSFPGTVVSIDRLKGILVQCRSGKVWLQRVQPEGRKPMEAFDFANGFRLKAGESLVGSS